MVERRRVVHDRRRLLLEAGHPMSSRVIIASLASLLVACGDETATPTAGADARRYTLALIGDPAITLHPGEVRALQALLAASEDGPVVSARIHFAFLDGNPAGARIDAGDVVTDDEGVATVRLTAGSTPAAFHLTVTAPERAAAPVAFAVDVVPLRRTLRVVPTPATSVSADGAHGSTLAGVAGTVSLKVRELDADTGAPIEGDTITFTLPAIANAHWSAGVSRTATAKTGAGGKAQAFLVTSQAAEGPWRVVAESAAGDAQVTFDVTIRCAFGICDPPPCGGACPIEDVPDVTGLWLTRHDFRIHDVLPFSAQEIFKALRLMDQTLLGQLTIPGIPGWLQAIVNAFVARLLQQYLPGWMQQLIHLCDDFATILGNLRSEGAMRLTRTTDLAHLSGTEVWTSLVFYWLPLCDGEIAGDPDKPPECARIDVLTHDSGFDETAQCRGEVLPSVSVELSPFNATLVKDGAGYGLQINQRRARLTMGKVLLILYDQLLGVVTGGEFQCIEEATECAPGMGCIVDCDGLARDVESATDGGVADEARLEDGKWTGDFFFPLDRKLPGTWEATRPE
ncbi:MAG: hypothetical protein E6J66_10815 [Deltaproteobacteria bacterium]|nr:MAG: hypothetical protein E6J66_10815 [Deltaproteobacteria bacterium]